MSEVSLGVDTVTKGRQALCEVPLEILRSRNVVVIVEKNNMMGLSEEG